MPRLSVQALGRFGRAWRRDREGATAVEFALVALPLIFLLFSLLELAMIFMIQTTLENAAYNAARTIRTGAAQTGGGSTATIKNAVCANLTWLGSACTNNVTVDVRSWPAEANNNFPVPDPTDKSKIPDMTDGKKILTPAWAPGNPGDIVLVRVTYTWKLVTPFLTGGLERMEGGVNLITASSVFRNEPYS